VLIRDERLERVQVKYACSNGEVIQVKCFSHSLTNGKIRKTKRYTAETIDLLAVYDATSDCCYYVQAQGWEQDVPAFIFDSSPREMASARAPDRQRATSIPEMEPAGFEPATFRMQTERSAS
jgi:PD-(D/E)XK endonuclease